jgi:hypothetical protein
MRAQEAAVLHPDLEAKERRSRPAWRANREIDSPQVVVLAERDAGCPIEPVRRRGYGRDGAAGGHADDRALRDDRSPDVAMHVEGDPVDGKQGRALCEHRGGARASVRVDADPNQPPAFRVGDDELALAEGDPIRAEREAEPEDPASEEER